MGRRCRYDYEGACHHIVVKGIDGKPVFKTDAAKNVFMAKLQKYRAIRGVKLFAYCLMDNHVHLFIQSGKSADDNHLCISELMRDVLSSFARWYNKEFKRTGPLFNSRFASFICESTPYLIHLIDYIHRNPVSAYKTKTYAYKHSSYRSYKKSGGICDLAEMCEHIGMSKDELMEHLDARMASDELPLLNKLLDKLRQQNSTQTVADILTELEFRLEDFRGSRLAKYFSKLRRVLIKELNELQLMKIADIAQLFDISKSYVYQVMNST